MDTSKIIADIDTEIAKLQAIRLALADLDSMATTTNGRHAGTVVKATGKRGVSAAARRKMSLAQKARWAKSLTHGTATATRKPRKVMSAAARRRIGAAQRARWAKVKAKKAA